MDRKHLIKQASETPSSQGAIYRKIVFREIEQATIEIKDKIRKLFLFLQVIDEMNGGESPLQRIEIQVKADQEQCNPLLTDESGIIDSSIPIPMEAKGVMLTIPGTTALFRKKLSELATRDFDEERRLAEESRRQNEARERERAHHAEIMKDQAAKLAAREQRYAVIRPAIQQVYRDWVEWICEKDALIKLRDELRPKAEEALAKIQQFKPLLEHARSIVPRYHGACSEARRRLAEWDRQYHAAEQVKNDAISYIARQRGCSSKQAEETYYSWRRGETYCGKSSPYVDQMRSYIDTVEQLWIEYEEGKKQVKEHCAHELKPTALELTTKLKIQYRDNILGHRCGEYSFYTQPGEYSIKCDERMSESLPLVDKAIAENDRLSRELEAMTIELLQNLSALHLSQSQLSVFDERFKQIFCGEIDSIYWDSNNRELNYLRDTILFYEDLYLPYIKTLPMPLLDRFSSCKEELMRQPEHRELLQDARSMPPEVNWTRFEAALSRRSALSSAFEAQHKSTIERIRNALTAQETS